MSIQTITERELVENGVSSLPLTPTASPALGGRDYTPSEVKAAFDRLPRLIAARLNALLGAVTDGTLLADIPVAFGDGTLPLSELLALLGDHLVNPPAPDSAPASESGNTVTSGGVYTALAALREEVLSAAKTATDSALRAQKLRYDAATGVLSLAAEEGSAAFDSASLPIPGMQETLALLRTLLGASVLSETVEDAFTTRPTAGGLAVVDEAPTTVHKITGASAVSANLAAVADQTIVSNGVTFIGSATDGTVQMTGSVTEENEYATATVTTGFYLPVGTYTLYAPHKADKVGWHVRNAQSTSIAELNWNGTTTAVSFTVSAAGSYHLYVFIPRGAGTLDYTETPMLLRGDRTANLPAFEPYYAGVKHASFTGIASCGTALVDFSETVPSLYITNGTLYPNDTFRSETVYCPCAGGAVYRYANEITSGYRQFVVVFYDADKQMLLQTSKASYGTPIAVTSPVGAQYMRCSFSKVMVNGEYTTVPEQPMVYAAETQPPYEPYVGDETFALTTPVTLGKWDTIDVDAQKQVVGTVTETQDTPYTEEQLAQFDEYILSADGKTVAYKTEAPTETALSLPKTYRAWNDGQETITGDPSGLPLTVTQDYYVKAGGENV